MTNKLGFINKTYREMLEKPYFMFFILLEWQTWVGAAEQLLSRWTEFTKTKKIIIYCLTTRWPASLQSCSVQKLKDLPQASGLKCMFHNARSYLNTASRSYRKKFIGWHLHRDEDAIWAEKSSLRIQDSAVLCRIVCYSSEPSMPGPSVASTKDF